jgi:hypothetical protein
MAHRALTAIILAFAAAGGQTEGAEAQAMVRPAEPLDRPAISRAANALFQRACVAHFADRTAMEQVLRDSGLRLAPPEAAAQLARNNPGRVWRGSDKSRPMAVVTREAGVLCQVMAPHADIETSVAAFRRSAEELRRAGMTVTPVRDEPAQLGGQPGQQVFFRIGPEAGGILLALSVATARPGGLALLMTASHTAPEPR